MSSTGLYGPLKVLHLASFAGNNGDGAMHDGAYRTRSEDMPFLLNYESAEIRNYIQWGCNCFDNGFVELVNHHDILLVGGISLFQLWRKETVTGTYFDLPQKLLAKIKRPIVLYGLGCDATRGIDENATEKIRNWIDVAMETGLATFSLRNDNSYSLLADALGGDYVDQMSVIPDGALFAEPQFRNRGNENFVVLNIAGDMADVRYAGRPLEFAQALATEIESLLAEHPDCRCHLAPSVYSDLELIAHCLAAMDDRLRRTRVSVGAYDAGLKGWQVAYETYRRARVVLAMRFHANVVSVGLGVPTIGLSSHHKVSGFYREIGLPDRCVNYTHEKRQESLTAAFKKIRTDLELPVAMRVRDRQRQAREAERIKLKEYHERLGEWLSARVGVGVIV